MALPTLRSTIATDLDRMFDRFWSDWDLPMTVELPSVPSLDVYEKDGTYLADVAIPGYKPEDINVEVSGNTLTVSGKYDTTNKTDEAKYHRREIRRGSFERMVTFPQELDPGSITAKTERGILHITAKPLKAANPTKVAVTGA